MVRVFRLWRCSTHCRGFLFLTLLLLDPFEQLKRVKSARLRLYFRIVTQPFCNASGGNLEKSRQLSFRAWARSQSLAPYNSFGNGSAMRVSPAPAWPLAETRGWLPSAA